MSSGKELNTRTYLRIVLPSSLGPWVKCHYIQILQITGVILRII
jgi:hypothetical protein